MNIPTEMKAAAVDRFGGPEVLHTETVPVPELGPKEILLRVDTAGIGVWDPWMREGGADAGNTQFPYVMGNDGAGEVIAVGPGVRRLEVGDRAWAYQAEGGFYAEYVKVREDHAAKIPDSLDAREAGALGADGITAIEGLDDHLRVRKNQRVMIVGASGGIGHIAVQLAKRMGAKVLAVASGDDGVELVKRLGADAACDGKRDDVAKAAKEFAPKGLDAALILAGGEQIDAALEAAMKRPGRIAHPNGVEPVPKAPEGVKLIAYDGTPRADAFDRLNALIAKAPFHVELSKTYSLDEVPEAHREVEQHHLGKLAITIH